eukprot:c12297_g2_i1 orf=73-267(-)
MCRGNSSECSDNGGNFTYQSCVCKYAKANSSWYLGVLPLLPYVEDTEIKFSALPGEGKGEDRRS